MSVVKVEHPQTFEGGRPKAGGLGDQRMGTLSRDFKCLTCESDAVECPGHFGHIELAKPVFHIGFMDQIIRILRAVCMHCSKLKCYKVTIPCLFPLPSRSLPSLRFALFSLWEPYIPDVSSLLLSILMSCVA